MRRHNDHRLGSRPDMPPIDYDEHSRILAYALEQAMMRGAEHQVRMAASLGGVLARGAIAYPVAAGKVRVSAANGTLMGFALRNTSGAAVTVFLRHRDIDGDAILPIVVPATTASATGQRFEWFGPGGITFNDGLFLDLQGSGAIDGSIFLRAGLDGDER